MRVCVCVVGLQILLEWLLNIVVRRKLKQTRYNESTFAHVVAVNVTDIVLKQEATGRNKLILLNKILNLRCHWARAFLDTIIYSNTKPKNIPVLC